MTNREFADELRKTGGERAIVGAVSGYLKHAVSRNQVVIVDGVYKMDDIAAIKEQCPNSQVLSLFITANKKTRIQRVQQREKISADEARARVIQADVDRLKLGYSAVMRNSDFIIRNKGDFRRFYQDIQGVARKAIGPVGNKTRRRNKQ